MYKVFYDKETLEIKGMSTGEISMDFPFIETEVLPELMWNYEVKIIDGVAHISVIKESFTSEEWDEIINN